MTAALKTGTITMELLLAAIYVGFAFVAGMMQSELLTTKPNFVVTVGEVHTELNLGAISSDFFIGLWTDGKALPFPETWQR